MDDEAFSSGDVGLWTHQVSEVLVGVAPVASPGLLVPGQTFDVSGRWNAVSCTCLSRAAGVDSIGWFRFVGWNALALALWSTALVGIGAVVHDVAMTAQTAPQAASGAVLLVLSAVLVTGYLNCPEKMYAVSCPPGSDTDNSGMMPPINEKTPGSAT